MERTSISFNKEKPIAFHIISYSKEKVTIFFLHIQFHLPVTLATLANLVLVAPQEYGLDKVVGEVHGLVSKFRENSKYGP